MFSVVDPVNVITTRIDCRDQNYFFVFAKTMQTVECKGTWKACDDISPWYRQDPRNIALLSKLPFFFFHPADIYDSCLKEVGSKGWGGREMAIESVTVAGLGLKMMIYNGLTNVKCSDLCQSLNFHRMAVL